jgi:hypothetical protein
MTFLRHFQNFQTKHIEFLLNFANLPAICSEILLFLISEIFLFIKISYRNVLRVFYKVFS